MVVTLEVWDVFVGLFVLGWREAFLPTVASDEIVEFVVAAVIVSVFGSSFPPGHFLCIAAGVYLKIFLRSGVLELIKRVLWSSRLLSLFKRWPLE